MKLAEDEDDYWNSLQPLKNQSEDYKTSDSAPEVCGTQTVNQVLDQYITGQKKKKLQNIKKHSWMH
jgi:hypothetical protein